jgi:cystatin-A/B
MVLAGGHSAPRSPNEEERNFLTTPQIRQMVGDACGFPLDTLDPIKITSQVVAGTNYQVKYHVGGTKYVHAKFFRPLPCYKDEKPALLSFMENKTLEDEL